MSMQPDTITKIVLLEDFKDAPPQDPTESADRYYVSIHYLDNNGEIDYLDGFVSQKQFETLKNQLNEVNEGSHPIFHVGADLDYAQYEYTVPVNMMPVIHQLESLNQFVEEFASFIQNSSSHKDIENDATDFEDFLATLPPEIFEEDDKIFHDMVTLSPEDQEMVDEVIANVINEQYTKEAINLALEGKVLENDADSPKHEDDWDIEP